jgi:hypothetical protein
MDAGVLQTHTATQQWQSFEIRMRRRRIDRCVLRAAVAIDAGVLEDAREALEEVERLDPHEPAIEPLRAKLAAAKSRAVAPVEAPAGQPPQPESLVISPAVSATPLPEKLVTPVAEVPVTPLSGKPVTVLPEKPLTALPEKLVTALPEKPVTPLPEHTVPETLTRELGFLAVPEASRRVLPASAAAVLIAISGTAGWFVFSHHSPSDGERLRADTAVVYDSNTTAPRTTPRAEHAVAESAVRLSETAVTAAATNESVAAPTTEATTGAPEPALSSSLENASVEAPRTVTATPPAEPSSSNTTNTTPASPAPPPPAPAIERRAIPASLEPSPSLPDPAPAPVTPASGAVPAVSSTDTAASPIAPVALAAPSETPAAAATAVPAAPSPTTSQPAEENRVRNVLSRYEAAYSALDAAAASAVWPGVDRRALTSAFQALSSQSVSLGRCDVSVTGEAAQVDCKGTAKWEPKIGGGLQSAARQWRFDLRNTGGDWIITRATVR